MIFCCNYSTLFQSYWLFLYQIHFMQVDSNWFKEWFNTPYYHTLYKHRDYKEAERFIKNLIAYLNLKPNSKCLDLACGKGRHAEQLCSYNFDVIGVDLSENSILEAKKLEKENLSFDVHDMRQVYKEDHFDAIFNLFTSFGYFDDTSENLKMLQSVNTMLKSDGVFLMDFMNAEKVIENLVPKEEKTIDGINFKIKREFDGKHIFKNIKFSDQGEDFEFTERVQALKKDELLSLFNEANLKVTQTFGDFDLNPYNSKKSNRLILLAQKQ